MRYRNIPRTDIRVSEVGFGLWTLSTGWWGDRDDAEAVRLLHAARDAGITFFDTADSYGSGRGETLLADAFRGRGDLVVATKFGYDWYNHDRPRGQRELPQDFSPAFVRESLEKSLSRLEVDAIDVYQFHNPRMPTMVSDDVFALMEDFVREGKIRSYGVALGPANGWYEEGLSAMRDRHVTSLQVIYNLLEQDPGGRFADHARDYGTGLFVRVPHSSGMLEGKYTPETTFPPEDHRSHRPRSWLIEGLEKVEQLRFLTDGREQTLGQAALKWLLADRAVVTTLPNIYGDAQIEEFAAAADLPDLTAEDLDRVRERYEANFGLSVEAEAPASATTV